MKGTFPKALKAVLIHEGGYINHPKDPGGATMKGVTQRVYDGWRASQSQKPQPVKLITDKEVESIYRKQYWDAVYGDDLPSGVDYVVFDGAVNSGPIQSVKWLQRALGDAYDGEIDGDIGVATLAAVNTNSDNDALVDEICDRRMTFLQSLKTWSTFGRGWTSRVAGVRKTGKAWASGKATPKVDAPKSGQARAPVTDVAPAPTKAPADLITGAGVATSVGAGTAAGTIKDAAEQLEPVAGMSATISTILTFLIIAGVVLAIGGVGLRVFQNIRAQRRAAAIEADA
jgi:lysozyme family protein